jgi:hypothetical protein
LENGGGVEKEYIDEKRSEERNVGRDEIKESGLKYSVIIEEKWGVPVIGEDEDV